MIRSRVLWNVALRWSIALCWSMALCLAGCQTMVGGQADAGKGTADASSSDASSLDSSSADTGAVGKGGVLPAAKNCIALSDCAGEDDGDRCNGIPYCDPKGKCRTKPNSAVICDTRYDTPCSQTLCEPKTGKCAKIVVAEGGACDDGRVCTKADSCHAGQCGSGTVRGCAAGLGCSEATGACDPPGGTCGSSIVIGAVPFTIQTVLAAPAASATCAAGKLPVGQGQGHIYAFAPQQSGHYTFSLDGVSATFLTKLTCDSTEGTFCQAASSAANDLTLSVRAGQTAYVFVGNRTTGEVTYSLTAACGGTCEGAVEYSIAGTATTPMSKSSKLQCGQDACGNACGTCGADYCDTNRLCRPIGDVCEYPKILGPAPASIHVDKPAGLADYDANALCGQAFAGPYGHEDVWSLTPPQNASYRIKVSGQARGVWVSDGCSPIKCIASGPSQVDVPLLGGKAYRVIVPVATETYTTGTAFVDLAWHDIQAYDISVCIPNCTNTVCGDDGCGGSCGSCEHGCKPDGQSCCVPDCQGKVCGSDGCNGNCGPCAHGCSPDQKTCCQPSCAGKICGSDGCDGGCGTATFDPVAGTITPVCGFMGKCTPDGTMCCKDACKGKICGNNACGDWCGSCPGYGVCAPDQKSCLPPDCVPQCEGKVCGPDGCGGACGVHEVDLGSLGKIWMPTCVDADSTCSPDGTTCCSQACFGKVCGLSKCGESCGTCPEGTTCTADQMACLVAGDVCSSAFAIGPLPFSATATTAGAKDDYGMCPSAQAPGAGAPDQVWEFTPPVTGKYTFSLSADFAASLYLKGDCAASPGACLTGITAEGGATKTMQVTLSAGAKTYAVIDGSDSAAVKAGNYTLGVKVCTPDCQGKVCGDDGCGGTCGSCTHGCTPDQKSCCQPNCAGKSCGSDGCDGTCGGGYLTMGYPPQNVWIPSCYGGACVPGGTQCCSQACQGKVCGMNECGDSCGTCPTGKDCSADQSACVYPTGDKCSKPFIVGALPFAATATTADALGDSFAVLCQWGGLWGKGSSDQVWQFTAPATGSYSFGLSADFNALLYVASDCAPTMLACQPGTVAMGGMAAAPLNLALEAGVTRYIIVDGIDNLGPGTAGAYELTVQATTSCTANCAGKACGPDGCGGECGTCPGILVCQNGTCAGQCGNGVCEAGETASCAADCACGITGSTCDDGNACTSDICNPADGLCAHAAVPGACDDGKVCTTGDACSGGACVGVAANCADGLDCTLDACNPSSGCQHLPHAELCDDDVTCTTDACALGAGCTHTENVSACDDGNACTTDSCSPTTGCGHVAATGGCDDSDLCTTGDTCIASACGGTAKVCTDGNACTFDACNALTGCLFVSSTAACTDSIPCTMDSCNPSTGCAHVPKHTACEDGIPCTADTCDASVGCLHVADSGSCNDGDVCTTDTCDPAKGCVFLAPGLDCDDNNACTTDTCNPSTGCAHANHTAACEDGNACTIGETCAGGTCVGGSVLSCTDSNPCTGAGSCDPVEGCVFPANTAVCNDNNACTTKDKCANKICAGVQEFTCNALDDCHLPGTCAPSTGLCSQPIKDDGLACSDGLGCTINDACVGGICKGQLNCEDGNACTSDLCDYTTGWMCQGVYNGSACSDDNLCTQNDVCGGGTCHAGPALTCTDSNPCTADQCNPLIGCEFPPASDGTPCASGTCQGGVCM